MRSPDVHPHAAKLALASEWRASLQESHAPGGALDAALQDFERNVRVIAQHWPRLAARLRHGLREDLEALCSVGHRSHGAQK